MTIVFVIDTYNNSGGGGVATKRLVSELRKRGHNVRIIAAINDEENDPDYFKVPAFTFPGAYETHKLTQFYFGRSKNSILRSAIQGADIVQVQYPFMLAKGAIKMSNKLNVPVVGSIHIQPQNILQSLRSTSKINENIIWCIFKYFLFNRVCTIVAPSDFARNLLISKGVKADIVCISNGIPEKYKSQQNEKPNWFKNHFVILSVGRHAYEKRHALIIEAVKKSKYAEDIQLILAGRGELTQELKDLGKTLPIQPYIEYVSSEDKLRFLNTADLYIHASIIELESLATAEAIGCGLPCLISNAKHSAATQFSLDDRLLFNADDADHLASRINFWYENRKELKSIEIQTKMRNMANEYQLQKSIDKYEHLYQDIIAKNSNCDLTIKYEEK